MKQFFKSLAITSLLLFALFSALPAAATVYQWSRYDLSFETPDDGFVTFNSPTRFEVQWEDMVMTIQLYSQDKGDEKKLLTENLQRKAMGYNMYDLHDSKIKVKGFKKTYSIDGTLPDGSRAIIADLVSKRQNLIVEVTVVYLYGNREVVEDMIKSFAEHKDQPNHQRKRQKVQSKQKADREQKKEQQRSTKKEKLYDA
ncbi:MAG: hypothetical protein IKW85_04420 [Muribaculaceae bacterium]|nr:hypothetical protein [Muribaculaceae bacterium]